MDPSQKANLPGISINCRGMDYIYFNSLTIHAVNKHTQYIGDKLDGVSLLASPDVRVWTPRFRIVLRGEVFFSPHNNTFAKRETRFLAQNNGIKITEEKFRHPFTATIIIIGPPYTIFGEYIFSTCKINSQLLYSSRKRILIEGQKCETLIIRLRHNALHSTKLRVFFFPENVTLPLPRERERER